MRIAAILAATSTLVLAAEAAAQPRQWAYPGGTMQIDPRCTRMKDPVACTCALQTGGDIGPRGYWHYSHKAAPAYTACMQQAGHAHR
jgi:hypothetical protein